MFEWDKRIAEDPSFRARFGTEEACRLWLVRTRWPGGFVCAGCGRPGPGIPRRSSPTIDCPCGKETSILAGTLFEQTKKPIQLWLKAILFLCLHPRTNAVQLAQELDVNHKTAWTWCHKIRTALKDRVVPEPQPDLAFALEWNRHGRPEGEGPSCCRRLDAFDWTEGHDEEVEGLRLPRLRAYFRQKETEAHLPSEWWVRNVRALLLERFRGGLSERHLQAYLDQFAFTENRLRVPRTAVFEEVGVAVARTPPRPYRAIACSHPLELEKKIVLEKFSRGRVHLATALRERLSRRRDRRE
jgi:hypothetical protein